MVPQVIKLFIWGLSHVQNLLSSSSCLQSHHTATKQPYICKAIVQLMLLVLLTLCTITQLLPELVHVWTYVCTRSYRIGTQILHTSKTSPVLLYKKSISNHIVMWLSKMGMMFKCDGGKSNNQGCKSQKSNVLKMSLKRELPYSFIQHKLKSRHFQ